MDKSGKQKAKHRAGAVSTPGQIVWRLFLRGRFKYLPMLLSDYGREILLRKYDAIATDLAYVNKPHGLLGPIGWLVDRIVLNLPLHQDLRERLELVVQALSRAIHEHQHDGQIHLLSAPCGVIRDCLTLYRRLEGEIRKRVTFTGIDIDVAGDTLPEAERRAKAENLPMALIQGDLLKFDEILKALTTPMSIVNCIGFTPWLSLEEVKKVTSFFHEQILVKDGFLVIDNFYRHKDSDIGDDLEIFTQYHHEEAFEAILKESGFLIIGKWITRHRVNAVYFLKKM